IRRTFYTDGTGRLHWPGRPLFGAERKLIVETGSPVLPEAVGKRAARARGLTGNASGGVGRCAVFSRREGGRRQTGWRVRHERGDQVLIAAISGAAPNMLIIRFRLYARTWRLISVRTLS